MSKLLEKVGEYKDESIENVAEGLYRLKRNEFERAAQCFLLARLFSEMSVELSRLGSEEQHEYYEILAGVNTGVSSSEIAAMRALGQLPPWLLSMFSSKKGVR